MYAIAKAAKLILETEHKAASVAISSFPTGAMGLTPDHVKQSPEWRAAYSRYWSANNSLRNFNRKFLKQYRKEIAAERAK